MEDRPPPFVSDHDRNDSHTVSQDHQDPGNAAVATPLREKGSSGENRWPPVGSKRGRQRGGWMAAAGEFSMAVDKECPKRRQSPLIAAHLRRWRLSQSPANPLLIRIFQRRIASQSLVIAPRRSPVRVRLAPPKRAHLNQAQRARPRRSCRHRRPAARKAPGSIGGAGGRGWQSGPWPRLGSKVSHIAGQTPRPVDDLWVAGQEDCALGGGERNRETVRQRHWVGDL